MSTALQQALVEVGYKPTRFKPVTFENVIEKLFPTIRKRRKQRKIEVSRAGSHYKARYAGHASYCFGSTPKEAIERLKHIHAKS